MSITHAITHDGPAALITLWLTFDQINQYELVKIIQQRLDQSNGYYIIQDNVRYHTTELVQQELHKHGINTIVRIPPDLYPIEHVWSKLSGEIAKAEVVDGHDLINQAEAVWNDLTVIMCNNCIIHMNTVTQTIVDANDSRVCT